MPDYYVAVAAAVFAGLALGVLIKFWYWVSAREAAGSSLLGRQWERRLDLAMAALLIALWIGIVAVVALGGLESVVLNIVFALAFTVAFFRQRRASDR